MKRVLHTTWLLLIISQFIYAGDRSKQALRSIEKNDFEKAEEYLVRSMEKDSLNPLVYYAYGRLYLSKQYVKNDLDTAYRYALRAQTLLEKCTEEHQDEMDKADVTHDDFEALKSSIDSLAFSRADSVNSISGYDFFTSNFETAPQFIVALDRLHQMSFEKVEEIDTWQAYKDFKIKYPLAPQSKLAWDRFQRLVYEEKTASGTLEDLKAFLIYYENTPYRAELEQRIFDIMVARMSEEDILSFINTYSNERLTKKALGFLYYTSGIRQSELTESNLPVYEQFMDSVLCLNELNGHTLFPKYNEGKYTFHDSSGQQILPNGFNGIDRTYYCGNVTEKVLHVEKDSIRMLINREGTILFHGEFDSYEDVGSGIIVVRKGDLYGAVHVMGDVVLDVVYEGLTLLDSHLISFKSNGKNGLVGLTGQEFLPPVYDDIYAMGVFWVLEVNESYYVATLEQILNDDISSKLQFEELELIDSIHIVAYTEKEEYLFNQHLEVISPPNVIGINTIYNTWVFKTPQGYIKYDPDRSSFSETIYQEVLQNERWLGLKKFDQWIVYNKSIDSEPILNVDSLKLLGEDISIIFRENQGMAIFPNKQVVDIQEGEYLQALDTYGKSKADFLVIRREDKLQLFKNGIFEFSCFYDELSYLNDSVFVVKKGNKFGAIDINGDLILRVVYDAISQSISGVSDVLLNGEFGAYNFEERVLLKIGFVERIQFYNEHILKVSTESGYGLLDKVNNMLVPEIYEELVYWTDSAFLGKKEGLWEIRNIYDKQSLLEEIVTYSILDENGQYQTIEISLDNQYGVYHSELGLIIPPVFSDIYNVGSLSCPVYFAERSFSEADYSLVVYYDSFGNKIGSNAYKGNEYELIICD